MTGLTEKERLKHVRKNALEKEDDVCKDPEAGIA